MPDQATALEAGADRLILCWPRALVGPAPYQLVDDAPGTSNQTGGSTRRSPGVMVKLMRWLADSIAAIAALGSDCG